MNIWEWVNQTMRELDEQGHHRLAALMDRLPSAVIEVEKDEVEAIVPEALALARALELPWVEIYIRHWERQSIWGGFETLQGAIELLEFSHRPEHIDCPQSVCTVQDVSIAYAESDGPGFAEQRLAICEETLERIDPSWACFDCILSEKIGALNDLARHEEALEVAQAGREALAAAGKDPGDYDHLSQTLLHLGRPEEALTEARPRADEKENGTFAYARRQKRTRALLDLGRIEEAREEHLPLEIALRDPKYHEPWARNTQSLVEAGEYPNDWELGAALNAMVADHVRDGRASDGVDVAEIHARLALDRGAPSTARHALGALRDLAARLRDPSRMDERIAALEAAIEAAPAPSEELGEDPEAYVEGLLAEPAEASDPERDVERLLAARRRWPDSQRVVEVLYSGLRYLGRPGEALALAREFADAHPGNEDAQLAYGHSLIGEGDIEAARALAEERLEGAVRQWLLARAAYAEGDLASARAHGERIVAAEPDARNARRLLAQACEDLEDWAAGLEHRSALAAATDEEGDHWDRLIPATVVGDWAAVRESGKRLGMEFEHDDGPVDESWAFVRLRFDARDIVLGLRTGPVSARVLTVSGPDKPQHAGDRVVFHPTTIGETAEGELHLFDVVTVLEEGPRRAFPFDGLYPGEEAFGAWTEALREDGWIVDVRSSREYQLEVAGERRPAVYGFLALPDELAVEDAHERLRTATAEWAQPFTWLPLAEAAGDADVVARQREQTEEFALY